MEELPPELRDRRDSIFDRVTATGRTRRRRRAAAVVALAAVMLAIPVTAVALHSAHSDSRIRVSSAPSTGASMTSTSAATGTTDTTVKAECHNSVDPACGPLRYNPPISNEPAHLEITSAIPSSPKVGEKVTFTLRATDPDSVFNESSIWCNGGRLSFGDKSFETMCIADCANVGFGTWDPPAPKPSDLTFHSEHTYLHPGTFDVKITVEADVCGPRPSEATASTTITIGAN